MAVRDPIYSASAVALGDNYTDAATFNRQAIDKVDVNVSSGDALAQFLPFAEDEWRPDAGMLLKGGFFTSVVGLQALFDGGPVAVRFKRATVGAISTVDVWIYSI